MRIYLQDVPLGETCYKTIPAPDSGFQSAEEIEHYLQEKYGDDYEGDFVKAFFEYLRLVTRTWCPFWNPTEHGFVECRFLNRRAYRIPIEEEDILRSIRYFGSEASADENITGYLLGDAIKECKLNRLP
jgi:hypothetical protein